MPIDIPFINKFSNFSEEVVLEDTTYTLDFIYNNRNGQWSMSIIDINLIPLVQGVPLITLFSLFDQYPNEDLPGGVFFVIDTTDKEEKVTRDNIGSILSLTYIPEDELDTI